MTLEEKYTAEIDLGHRKKFAQFFTPEPIADLMVDWILAPATSSKILEPAFGLGVFTRNILRKKQDVDIKGFDIDKIIFDKSQDYFAERKNVSLALEDYMYNDWQSKYDGIICNPPYQKFHDYDNKGILAEVEKQLKFKLNGFTNLYTLFLLKSIHQLKNNGRAAYIVPSEFLNSDYGVMVKKHLLHTDTLRHIFVFDFKENVFDNALTTASVLLLAKDHQNEKIHISPIESKADLTRIKTYIDQYPTARGEFSFTPQELNPEVKWRRYYKTQNSLGYKNLISFSRYAKVMRGIATGANGYFKFSPSKAEKHSIPRENLLPCVTAAKDISGNFFTPENFEDLVKKDSMCYLFNGENPHTSEVLDYIRLGEKEKIHEKYLTSKRKPWYSLEKRPPAPIWVAVFNREGVKFIRNTSGISNLTTFHCVYPTADKNSERDIDLLFSYLITDVAHEIFDDNRREYGGGLKKFEPNDLNKSLMLDVNMLKPDSIDLILKYYEEFKKKEDRELLKQIDQIFRTEFSIENEQDTESKIVGF